jgi:hypothetical protein
MKIAFRLLLFFLLLTALSCSENKNEKPITAADQPKNDSTQQVNNEIPYNPYTAVDVSPMDMTYFPVDYPKLKMAKILTGQPLARVIYSRPHLQGRSLFNGVLKYGEPWRLGANEATELELFKAATIAGKKIPAGRYVLYCIPQKDKWTIVLNSSIDSWGLHPDESGDIARFDIPASTNGYRLEYFTMLFEKKGEQADLLMAWDNIEARLSFQF